MLKILILVLLSVTLEILMLVLLFVTSIQVLVICSTLSSLVTSASSYASPSTEGELNFEGIG
jgi:hypothetical protein